jgi:membrane fusion protein, multidrug efflux system
MDSFMTRRIVLFTLLGLLLIAGAVKGVSYWTVGRFLIETNNAYIESDRVLITPRVPGYIAEVLVKDNQTVKSGDILARLDSTEYRAKVAEAQAAVGVAQANIAAARANTARQRSAIDEAAASIGSARAAATRANSDLKRYAALKDEQWVSTQRFQAAQADAATAAANVERSKAGLASQSQQISVLSTSAQAALAQYKVALAKVETVQVDLENTIIRAPHDGVVANRMARVGQYARAGTLLMAVVPVGDIFVVANYKETQISGMRIGQPVTLHIDAFPDATFSGIVDSFAPATGSRFSMLPPENATGNFTKIVQRIPVRIRITKKPDLPLPLSDGMSVVTEIDIRK